MEKISRVIAEIQLTVFLNSEYQPITLFAKRVGYLREGSALSSRGELAISAKVVGICRLR